MADENNNASGNNLGPSPWDRDFAPLMEVKTGTSEAETQTGDSKRERRRGMPAARIKPGMVKEFAEEIDTKVKSGTSRMRWFANHLILFAAAIAAAIPLRLTVFIEYHDAFFYVPIGGWIALLAFHARYAMVPLLRRSRRESLIKAVVPDAADQSSSEQG